MPSPAGEALRDRGGGVELGGHEVGRAAGVELERVGRVVGEREALLGGPVGDRPAAALQDRDVERVDADLLEDLRRRRPSGAAALRRRLGHRGRDLLLEALQRPVPAALDLGRLGGQRDDRPERLLVARELEVGDVVLEAVVVGGERRRAHELHRAVGPDEAAAGPGGWSRWRAPC